MRPILRDPNDKMVLEVAVNGEADAIVTFNLRDYDAVPKTFNISPRLALGSLTSAVVAVLGSVYLFT